MKIGLFGGTFNPTHRGHLEVLEGVKKTYGLDKIFIIPSYITPGKFVGAERVSPKHRKNILKHSVNDFNKDWLKISNFEFKNEGTSYTEETVKHFKYKFPEADLIFIMGDDRYPTFSSWKNYEFLRKELSVIILRRHNVKKLKKIDKGDQYYTKNIIPISSSETLESATWSNLYPSAKKYIAKNNLYLKELTFRTLGEKRFEHSMSVATHAMRLMRDNSYFGFKKDAAYLAGLIHDNAKFMNEKDARKYLGKNFSDIPYKALHGYVTEKWMREEYGMKDKNILSAISKHTLASGVMSKFDKVIYVSDKIANNRKDRKSFVYRRLAYKDIEETFSKILRESTKRLIDNGIQPHELTNEALNKYAYKSDIKIGDLIRNDKNARTNKWYKRSN